MPGNVHRRDRIVKDLGAALEQVIDQRMDRALVARNKARRQYHDVIALDVDLWMRIRGQLRQRRERLALAAARKEDQLLTLEEIGLSAIDKGPGRQIELPGFHP